MTEKLDSYLVGKYPKIFKNRYSNSTNTSMCWGFEHGDGWFWLLDQLCYSIQSYIDMNNKVCLVEDNKISQVVASQVKEKFGVLNFYYYGGDSYIDGMISMAENMSASICEFCGTTENIGSTKGWISTICKTCYDNSDDTIKNRVWTERENDISYSDTIKEVRKIKIEKLNKSL